MNKAKDLSHSGLKDECSARKKRKKLAMNIGGKRSVCEFCGKAFSDNYVLNCHKRSHTGEKPFKCQLCDQSFAFTGHLSYHTKAHNNEKIHECGVCHKSFLSNHQLKEHSRFHTGEKPYKCHLCDKSFSRSFNLKCHIKTHTGEKPYECELCQKTFAEKSDMRKHFVTHSEVQPFKCDHCQVMFKRRANLSRHMIKQHNAFGCGLLQNSVAENVVELARYSMSHIEDDAYNDMLFDGNDCSIDDTITEEEQNLDAVVHQASSGDDSEPIIVKSYGCVICDEMFLGEIEFMEHCVKLCYFELEIVFPELFAEYLPEGIYSHI